MFVVMPMIMMIIFGKMTMVITDDGDGSDGDCYDCDYGDENDIGFDTHEDNDDDNYVNDDDADAD